MTRVAYLCRNHSIMDSGLSSFLKKINLTKVSVLALTEINRDVFVLSLNRAMDFIAGQVIALTTNSNLPPRLYSICSGISEPISILFNVKENGALTPQLARLKGGDELLISSPFGAFLGDNHPAWWIASGTGIAPFRSMIRSGLGAENIIIHGGRTLDSFYFNDELSHLYAERYIRCCTQEDGEGVYNGRLTEWLREYENLPKNIHFYLCGSAEMVVEVRDILLQKGIEIEHIMSEIYF